MDQRFSKINLDLFEYKIDSGIRGKIENDILVLNYTSPKDTTRLFKLSIQKDRMILNENDIIFELKNSKNWINDIFRGISFVSLLFAFSRNKVLGIIFKGMFKYFFICIDNEYF